MGATEFSIDEIVVTRNNENKYLISLNSNSGESIVTISFDDVSAIDSIVEDAIEGTMTRYKLVNNSNDVNQITIEADYTGFHVVAQSGEEYLKDNGDGTYTAFVKNGDTFTSTNVNKTTYDTEYKKYVTAHTFDWVNVPLATFKLVDGKYVSSGNVNLTDTGTRYEYYFSNIVVDPENRTITWDYKVHDKATNQDSPVYPIVVSTVFTEITYPTVG